ncbi:Hydrolases of the alpha/beta superfamily [plant metagenome]|uniref:Hydrolases of the alpha/beta superfamily n=1 Tax=plant metagenome TaxID=1297885 RepID=A0A484PGL0_9ZZZZ
MSTQPSPPLPISFQAADGHTLHGRLWRHEGRDPDRSLVILNAATSVASRYYGRYADYLFRHGMDVMTYDYRGIGLSREGSLRQLDAGWTTWGEQDFEAAIQYAFTSRPYQPIDVVAHSVGGFVTGLAASNHRLRRVCTVGAQIAYWRDFAPRDRLRMLLKWQVVMPALTRLLGYFPGKALGWLEDTPRGVVHEWTTHMRRLESQLRRGVPPERIAGRQALVERCENLSAPILAISVTDDDFGTEAAIERLLAYFRNSRATHLRISPESIGEPRIGHFAFFHSRYEKTLWPVSLNWLRTGCLAPGTPGVVVAAGRRNDGMPPARAAGGSPGGLLGAAEPPGQP